MTTDQNRESDIVDRFLAAASRERKALLSSVLVDADAARAKRLAPAVRDRSPRVSTRIASLLARHRLDALFARQLEDLPPGRVAALSARYRRIRGNDASKEVKE